MNVAYVTPYYNGECDGRFGRFHDWVHTARDMDDAPFEFDVYAFTASNADETLSNTPLAVLGEATELWGSKWNKAEHLFNAPEVKRGLQSTDYDVIHVLMLDWVILPTVLSTRPDAPVVIGPDIAGWAPNRSGMFTTTAPAQCAKYRAWYLLRNLLARALPYDRVVAFSEHHRRILETFGISAADISLLPGGVSPRFAVDGEPPRNTPPELLYVGDFSAHKGYPLFLEALDALEVPATARVVGAGDPNQDLIEALGLGDRVTVEGFVPRADLPAYYRRADLYVNPSIDETAGPNTQLEALATGTPVVATDLPGINEFAPPGAVELFSPRDVDALTDAIATALADLEPLTAAARRQSDTVLATRTLDGLATIYERVRSA